MDCSTPGLPVHHQLPEFTQTHVHWVGDAIQPSHPLSSPSPSALNLPSIRVFSNESALCITWPKYWSFSFNISPTNEHTGLSSCRMDWLDLLAVQGTLGSLYWYIVLPIHFFMSPRGTEVSIPINSSLYPQHPRWSLALKRHPIKTEWMSKLILKEKCSLVWWGSHNWHEKW